MEQLLSLNHSGAMCLAFSNTGDYLLSGGKDRSINLFNSVSGELIKTYSGGHNYEIKSLKISFDNTHFLSSGQDSYISLWDVSKGKIITKFTGHKKTINSLSWNFNNNIILSGSEDNTVRCWDLRENNSIDVLTASTDSVIKVNANTDQIVSGSVDGFIQTYDIRCGVVYVDNLKEIISGMDTNKEANIIATTHADGILRVVNKDVGQVVKAFYQTHKAMEYFVPCSITVDLKVVVGNDVGEISVFDITTGRIDKFLAVDGQIFAVLTHPEKKNFFATASANCVKCWKF